MAHDRASSRVNLTRQEASERAALIGPHPRRNETVHALETVVKLDLTKQACDDENLFLSTTIVRFGSRVPGASTFVDIASDRVRSIRLNGASLDPKQHHDGARVTLPDLAEENELEVVAECRYMNTGEGLHRFVDPVDDRVYLYTQFETADAHRVYTCFDQPDLKTTFELEVVAPADWQIVSVTAPDIAPTALDDNPSTTRTARWHFPASKPISTYVTAIVAGPYHVVRDSFAGRAAEIPLGVFCRRSLAEHLDADEIFTVTKQGFQYFERIFERPYPFEKYDQLFVPEFNAGAMENAGAVTFLEEYIFRSRVTDTSYESRASTILHEMAHMWFGDLVTMRWWDDLWLNESFATYMSTLAQAEATRWTNAWTTFANEEKTWAYRQDQLSTTHPIAAEIVDIEAVETNFDGITYAKGASVLKQLVAWVGRDAFFAGLRAYFERHEWGNSTLQDLLRALESASGRDLSDWSKQWLESAGINTLRPSIETDESGVITSFAVLQEAPAEHHKLRSHRLTVGFFEPAAHGLTRTRQIELDIAGARTDIPEFVGVRRPALVLVNDDDLTYAKIRLDETSLATVVESIGDITDSLPRALCWSAAWDMTRDAEMATRDYIRLVINLLDAETDLGVLQSLLRQARLAAEQWADPAFRSVGLDMLAAAAYSHARTAKPGSDYQLAFLRGFAATASSAEHLDTLASIYAGETVLSGLPLDTDLRWSLVTRLAAHGRAGAAEIDVELSRDDTAAGRRHAAAARAAMPTADAKEQAWRLVIDNRDTHNAEISAIIGGFHQANQTALLAPYLDRYFEAIGEVWQNRTGDIARGIATRLFPFLIIEESTIAKIDGYLETRTPPVGLRRILAEHRDALTRALRARARDTAAAARIS